MKMDNMFDVDDEYWLPIDGFINYSVSTYGNVRNERTGRVLRGRDDGKGYYKVALYENGKRIDIHTHRLVANTFISN